MLINYFDHIDSIDFDPLLSLLNKKYKLRTVTDLDIDGKHYVYLDGIRILNSRFLYTSDTARGDTYEEAVRNLIRLYLDRSIRIRKRTPRGEVYFTGKMRLEIKRYIIRWIECIDSLMKSEKSESI